MKKLELIIIISVIVMFLIAIVDRKIYIENNYDVRGFRFVCQNNDCEIRHTKFGNKVKYVEKIDISKIEKFSYKIEKIPRTNSDAYVIYADCKDGTSFRLSPLYVSPSVYLKLELIDVLNNALANNNTSFDIKFP